MELTLKTFSQARTVGIYIPLISKWGLISCRPPTKCFRKAGRLLNLKNICFCLTWHARQGEAVNFRPAVSTGRCVPFLFRTELP